MNKFLLRFAEAIKQEGGVYLHHSRVPLDEAILTEKESIEVETKCQLGMCFN